MPIENGRHIQHPIPEVIAPADRRCIVLYVPDQREHLLAFWSTLFQLAYWFYWERTPGKEGTQVAQVWREVYRDARERYLAGECCPDDVQPPPAPPVPPLPPIFGGGGGQVGSLGMTIEELEEIIMGCLDISNSIRWNEATSQIEVWSCQNGWVALPGFVGTIPASSAIQAGMQSFDEWVASGAPPTAPLNDLTHDRYDVYTTDDSLKCAKATAIVNHIWDAIEGWHGVADDLPTTVMTSVAFGALITSWFQPLSMALHAIGQAFALFTNIPSAEVMARLETDLAKTALKEEWLCALVDRMEAPGLLAGALKTNRMTSADIAVAFELFEDIVNPHETTRALLGFFSVEEWKQATAARAQSEECGCDAYLPLGYLAPSAQGTIQRVEMVYGDSVSTGLHNYLAGNPYGILQLSPDTGQHVGGNVFRTTYIGANTSGGQSNKYTGASVLIAFPAPVNIDAVEFDMDVVGVPAGAVAQTLSYACSFYVPATGWQTNYGSSAIPLVDTAGVTLGGSGLVVGATHAVFGVRSRNTNENLYVDVSNIRFTGSIGGAGFMDKAIGQEIP